MSVFYETYQLIFKNGAVKNIWSTKDGILDNMTARDYLNLDHIEILNKGYDEVKHRPIKKEDLK